MAPIHYNKKVESIFSVNIRSFFYFKLSSHDWKISIRCLIWKVDFQVGTLKRDIDRSIDRKLRILSFFRNGPVTGKVCGFVRKEYEENRRETKRRDLVILSLNFTSRVRGGYCGSFRFSYILVYLPFSSFHSRLLLMVSLLLCSR